MYVQKVFRAPKVRTVSPVLRELFAHMRRNRIPTVVVATELNMTRVGLTYWGTGRSDPDITKVEAMAEILGYELVLKPKDFTNAKVQGDQVR